MIKIVDNSGNQEDCKHCKGKGLVVVSVVDSVSRPKDKKEKCIKCGGTGRAKNGK